MTAFTSANFQDVYYKQEGEVLQVVFSLAALQSQDTIDITPLVLGRKVSRLSILDHTATILGGFSSGTYASSEAAWTMVVSTDIITVARCNTGTDPLITVETVPS